MFALRTGDAFAAWDAVVRYADKTGLPVVPMLHRGVFETRRELTECLAEAHREESALGGEREGIVIRRAEDFAAEDFATHVCKSVRRNHVQTDQHWTCGSHVHCSVRERRPIFDLECARCRLVCSAARRVGRVTAVRFRPDRGRSGLRRARS